MVVHGFRIKGPSIYQMSPHSNPKVMYVQLHYD
jgi:hypothetical protein